MVVALLGLLAAACPGGETLSQDPADDEQETAEPDTAGQPAPALPQVEAAEATGTFTPVSGDCDGFTDTFTYTIGGDPATVTVTQPATGQSVSGPIDPETVVVQLSGEFEEYPLLVSLGESVLVGAYVHLPTGGCEGEMLVRFDFATGLCTGAGVAEGECPFSQPPPVDPECPFEGNPSCAEFQSFYDEQVCDAVGRCG